MQLHRATVLLWLRRGSQSLWGTDHSSANNNDLRPGRLLLRLSASSNNDYFNDQRTNDDDDFDHDNDDDDDRRSLLSKILFLDAFGLPRSLESYHAMFGQ